MPRSYEKQKICYMFSVLNEYNLLWKASYQERKRLGYFEKSKVYPRKLNTCSHTLNRLPNHRDPMSR